MSCGSRDHNVSTAFKRDVGCSIASYLSMLRLTVARISLEQSQFTVGEISEAVGFGSIQRFYTSYKAAFGKPPAVDTRRRRVKAC
ncbi:MAG: helix-turn-helix domain-containing protein [Gemmatimonas sp.]